MVRGLPVIVYELVLWLSIFVMDYLNVVRDLPVAVYMSWGYSTQLAQYSNFMDVCMTTQDLVRPVKEQAGTEINQKLSTHATNLEYWLQHQRHLLGYPHGLTME